MINKIQIYHLSLIILLFFGILGIYYRPGDGTFIKFMLNLHIYLSFLLIPLFNLKFLNFNFTKNFLIIYILLIGYTLFSFIRSLNSNEVVSLFGNPNYGPAFLIPFFFLWGKNANSVYWLHKISLISVKAGILLTPISFLLNLELPMIAFMPTFFILLNYRYVKTSDKIWIIIGVVVGIIVFWYGGLRTGIIRIVISLFIFTLFRFKLSNLVYKLIIILFLITPAVSIYWSIHNSKSIFQQLEAYKKDTERGLTTDTRTFLYLETVADLINNNSMLLGKGPVGTYYSDYFYTTNDEDGDYYIRHEVEVGVLYYLLKGGIVYLVLIFIVLLMAVTNSFKKINNNYIKSLAVLLASFFLVSFIENIPSYTFYFATVWIIVGICLSKNFKEMSNQQILFLMNNKV